MLCSPASSLVSTVMNDIISTMFNQKFMEELFKPQELYSKKALRTVYDRLAHASIMRLNQASMDKVSSCLHPWAVFLMDYHRLESKEMCSVVHDKRQAHVNMACS